MITKKEIKELKAEADELRFIVGMNFSDENCLRTFEMTKMQLIKKRLDSLISSIIKLEQK